MSTSVLRVHCLVIVITAAVVTPAFAQRELRDIPPPDAELERATFVLPEGFEVNLFAADPAIAKPIQMNFDARGRLWLASSEVYPQIKPGEPHVDRIVVVQDTDGDGVSDRTNVFAEGLLIPTGVIPDHGGAWVANSTELLFFDDFDDDLKADRQRIVLSGFGTEDTHHILHTLRHGPDGHLYFNQSIYIHSHIETPHGVRRLNAGGIWRFRPESMELNVYMRGLVNSWGHDFDRFGQSFATDGAGGEGINYIVPGAYYFTAADARRILPGLNPGSPKHCGLEILESEHFPADWQGSAITNDFRGHRVCRFVLRDNGSGYVSQEQQEVIRSDHVAFRPIDVKVGPDGALYIADWYNPIIQHGEVDFRDPRRDHTHGRIWRVTYKGNPLVETPDFAAATPAELVELLRSPNSWIRHHAKRQMLLNPDGVAIALAAADQPADNDEHLALEHLWSWQTIRQPRPELLNRLLNAESPHVRAAATRVLGYWKHEIPNSSTLLQKQITDDNARVRLEAIRRVATGGDLPHDGSTPAPEPADRIQTALAALNKPVDGFIDYALWLTVRDLADEWLPRFLNGQLTFEDHPERLAFALRAIPDQAPPGTLLALVTNSDLPDETRRQLAQLVAENGDANHVGELTRQALKAQDAVMLRDIATATRGRNLKADITADDLSPALTSENSILRRVALELAGRWRTKGLDQQVQRLVNNSEADPADRIAAIRASGTMPPQMAAQMLSGVLSNGSAPLAVRNEAAVSLLELQPGLAATQTAALFSLYPKDASPAEVLDEFLERPSTIPKLAEAVAATTLSADVARTALRHIRQAGIPQPELETAFRKAGAIEARKALTAEQRAALLEIVSTSADPARGEAIYRDQTLACRRCHSIGAAGGEIGPDMLSLGASAQPDYLLDSLLEPNKKVKENYNTVVVLTDEGRQYTGLQIRRTDQEIVLRDANGRDTTIPMSQVDDLANGLSLMPEGLVDELTDQEVADLVRFLSELGRTPEYSLSNSRHVRTWEAMQATPQAAFRLRRTSFASAATDDDAFQWQPVFSNLSGQLPLSDIPDVQAAGKVTPASGGAGFVRCYINVTGDGPVLLRVNETAGLELRIDDLPIEVTADMKPQLSGGLHRLTFTVLFDQRGRIPLRLEIDSPDRNDSVVDVLHRLPDQQN